MAWAHVTLSFPDNLTPGHRQYIEAVERHGTMAAASARLGISQSTLENGLKKARFRAGVNTTADLIRRYRGFPAEGTPA